MSFERMPTRPRVLGHRGARARARDNTMQSFELALLEGADGIELDVRMSADAELVIFHDPEVETTAGKRAVSSLSLGQLAQAMTPPPLTLRDVLDFRDRTGALLNVEL